MKRVLIVDLQQIYKGVKSLYIPLVYGTLRVYAEQFDELREGYVWLDPICVPESTERLMAQIDAPDVVGFSTYLWNERNHLKLAEAVKARWPSCLVVFGGPQVPRAPSDYLLAHPYVDICVHGEGEQPFTAVLREALSDAPRWEAVAGISFCMDGAVRVTEPAERIGLQSLDSPFSRGYFDDFVARGRALGFNLVASLETSRGCPYSCAFCNWGMATKTKPRHYPDERVRAEFEWVASQAVSMVFLIDANFGIMARDVALLEHMAALKIARGFPQWIVVSGFAKNNKDRTFEITRILQDSRFDEGITVNFSLQATSQTTLDAIDRQNIPLDSYRELSDKYARSGYTLTPDLIFPLPGETLDSFQAGYADLASWAHVNRIRVYPCVILRNSPMAAPAYREKWGLQTRLEVLRLPMLETICPDLEDEYIETVLSTAAISVEDAAQAKVFVAVVNAFEIYHLTSALRIGLTRLCGVSALSFYERLITMMRSDRMFATLVAEMYASFLAGTEHGEELGWTGAAHTFDGQQMMPVKALTYDAMLQRPEFSDFLRRFVDSLGLASPVLDELLQFQADAWIGPDYDPAAGAVFTYRHDWPAFLAPHGDDALRKRETTVRYAPRPSVVQFGYTPGKARWTLHFLAPFQHDTLCCHRGPATS